MSLSILLFIWNRLLFISLILLPFINIPPLKLFSGLIIGFNTIFFEFNSKLVVDDIFVINDKILSYNDVPSELYISPFK